MSNVELLSRITVDAEVCHGKPCVRGLRYPVEFLLELLSSDMTTEQILADYPDLEAEDLKAACAYGARLSQILVSTGNNSNVALSRVFATNLPALLTALSSHDFVELSVSAITIHA